MSIILFLTYSILTCNGFGPYSLDHDIHLSQTEIRYVTDKESIQISLKLFIDDLEEILELNRDIDLRLSTSQEHESSDSLIQDYIVSKLKIETNNQLHKMDFIGKETSEDLMAFWCYFEITKLPQVETIRIKNLLLHDLFEDQKNIVSYFVNNVNRKFIILDKNDFTFELND